MASDSVQTPTDAGDQGVAKESEELTREKLILKYKTLMALTNKIKTARNEALAENEDLKKEIEAANEKTKSLTQKHATAEEMLAVLTDQKLKMAMEIDDMKKDKQLHCTTKAKEKSELEFYKQENDRIRKENNDLLIKLQEKEKNEIQLQNDLKKLHENNENVIILCSNVRKEKFDIQKQLEEVQSALNLIENEKKCIFEILSKQFSKNFEDVNCLKKFFEHEMNSYCKYQCAEEINSLLDKNLNLKNKVEELNDTKTLLLKEKECSESNIANLNNKLKKLKSELSLVISDRDQILNNLESVRLETKHLIENSEKLADELEKSKIDKIKYEHELYSIMSSKNEEIEYINNQLLDLQRHNEELKASLLSCREQTYLLQKKKCECYKETIKNTENEYSSVINECNKSEDVLNAYNNRVIFDMNKLFQINRSFASITESIKQINIQLLEKEVKICETELNSLISTFDSVESIQENNCSNIKCSCFLLRNIGIKLKEGIENYEKSLTELKYDLDVIKSQFFKLNKEGNVDKLKEFISNIVTDKKDTITFQESNDVDDNEMSRMVEYRVLNKLLENKILICKEELSYALTQLHNAEELEELMKREIYSLKNQLCEVMSDREMLNEIVNDKVKVIMKLDDQLSIEQLKSTKLRSDLDRSQCELNNTKHALDEKCKNLESMKDKNVNIISKITELSDTNKILEIENDSLKNNMNHIIQQVAADKVKDSENNKLIHDLRLCIEQLKLENRQLAETSKTLKDKLSNCKNNSHCVRKELSNLKKQFSELERDTSNYLCKLQDINKMVMKLHQEEIIFKEASNRLPNIELQEFRTATGPNEIKVLIDSIPQKTERDDQISPPKKNFADKECQVNEEKNDNKQEVKEGSIRTFDELTSKNEEIPSPGEMEDLSAHTSAKIHSLETSLALAKQELTTAHMEITQLREEFHSYRLRAQTLLSKQKGELASQGEKEAKEHVEKLNNELESLRRKMEIILLEEESLKNRLSTLHSEKDVTDKKYDDISRALHQKIIDYDTLNTEYNAFKLSTDTLIHNGKILLEEKYKSDIVAKEAIINALKIELKEKQVSSSDDKLPEVLEFSHSINNVEEILLEREDAEGSETVATSFIDRHEFMPLDVLINNQDDVEENQVAILQEQISALTAELSSHDIRSKHLSSLLREAEKESARNAQQNTVLKEEVRRLERCLERQPLVANTEYLKNVVFKFFTLQSADERSRLVPVLDSILKLSPMEAQKLNDIARGEGGSRWSTYLPSWTGLG